ncbi:MAG TPA: rhomboid family intramembrane serine protease [Rhizobiaceae bacterium]|nr:rhomboid family intramembrane serine protease [Rhizobiaceae bacterium]
MFIPLHDANRLKHIHLQYVTLALIVVNVAIWFLVMNPLYASEDAIKAAVYSWGFIPVVASGEEVLPYELQRIPPWASYITYAFLHGGLLHLGGNMLFIWVFGDNVEDALGHLRYLFFYLCCAAAGAFVHELALPGSEAPLIGASGAAAGVVTAYLLLHPHVKVWVLALGRIPLRLSALWVIGAWIAFQIASFTFGGEEQVSFAAHVGGIAAGAVLLPVLKRKGVALFDRKPVPEVVPPLAPVTADEGHPLPGQPEPAQKPQEAAQPAEEPDKPSPWGRQPRGEQ